MTTIKEIHNSINQKGNGQFFNIYTDKFKTKNKIGEEKTSLRRRKINIYTIHNFYDGEKFNKRAERREKQDKINIINPMSYYYKILFNKIQNINN